MRAYAVRASAILAAIGLLLLPLAAAAQDQRTRWYSIDVVPAENAAPVYLTVNGNGLAFERYRSGDPTQQWTLTQTDYPAAPRVEGHGPLDGITDCGWHGCPFSGRAGGVRKFVNRASGACLAVVSRGRGVAAQPCKVSESQSWAWNWSDSELVEGVPPRNQYSALVAKAGGQPRCLAAAGTDKGKGNTAFASDCGQPLLKEFRFLETANVTCKANWPWELCFVEGQ